MIKIIYVRTKKVRANSDKIKKETSLMSRNTVRLCLIKVEIDKNK